MSWNFLSGESVQARAGYPVSLSLWWFSSGKRVNSTFTVTSGAGGGCV